MKSIVMLEGHDGAGKTTIAKGVSRKMGYTYYHFYDNFDAKYSIEPLSISEDELIALIKKTLDHILSLDENIVLDRGLITPLSVLSKERWHELKDYFDKISVILCYADIDTTIDRLKKRDIDESEQWDNNKWITLNKEIAEYFNLPIIDTTTTNTIEENIDLAIQHFETMNL